APGWAAAASRQKSSRVMILVGNGTARWPRPAANLPSTCCTASGASLRPKRRLTAMQVDVMDGRCRACDSVLEIVDADDATMTVECTECGDTYQVEPDAFGDGCMTYYLGIMVKLMERSDEE